MQKFKMVCRLLEMRSMMQISRYIDYFIIMNESILVMVNLWRLQRIAIVMLCLPVPPLNRRRKSTVSKNKIKKIEKKNYFSNSSMTKK